ncbi:TetR/AcrR family transcriptional regulator [Embleya sp. NBC_00896]|uniref:TetR/AcrR family transcriptional regulator n=1 Tax=Embleya sp. NBC_00896 TaxID=2975961 RepID=UPI003868668D|nr:TetR/AcrR family transcriptional regulator [Embleya sp. NBC_00896]
MHDEPARDQPEDPPLQRSKGRPRSTTADDAILAAARSLLADGGWAGLTMGDVATRAGVAKTTLYRRWNSKHELAIAAVAEMLGTLHLPDRGTDLRADIEDVVRRFAALLGRPEMRTALMGLVADSTSDPALRQRIREEVVDPQKRLVVEGRARAKSRGEISAPGDIDVDLVFDVISGTVVQHILVSAEPATDAWVQRFTTFVVAGLLA